MSHSVRRRRTRLRLAASLGAGLGLNLVMLAILVVAPRPRLQPARPLQVSLLPPLQSVPILPRPTTTRERRGGTAPPAEARPATGPSPEAQPSAGSAPAAGPAPAGPPGRADSGPDIGGVLRANLGCSDPAGYRLTPEERARCLARLGGGAREAPFIPAPIDRGKRAWFDATVAAYHSEGHLPGPVCKVFFSGPKTKFKPPHSLKIPGLPCYLVPPQGVLTEESAVAPPEHVETR